MQESLHVIILYSLEFKIFIIKHLLSKILNTFFSKWLASEKWGFLLVIILSDVDFKTSTMIIAETQYKLLCNLILSSEGDR